MITAAQKKARENFKKAIEYRKKTGCSLKEAFAHIKGKHTVVKKVGAVKKKSAKKKVLISPLKKVAKKKAAPKKAAKKPNLKYRGTLKSEAGKKMYKYSLGKKPTENTILNKIHKVKHEVESLDEAQHKHMSGIIHKKNVLKDFIDNQNRIEMLEKSILSRQKMLKNPNIEKHLKDGIKVIINTLKFHLKEYKIHGKELKKHI